MKLKSIVFMTATLIHAQAQSAPHDLFLQADDFKKTDSALQLTVALDAVNDTVDVFDLRQSEGISDDRGDYFGGHIHALYALNPTWQIEAAYHYREIDYAPDTNTIHTSLIGLRYTPHFSFLDKNDALTFRTSIWANRAEELKKSSATIVSGQRFETLSVHQPQDLQLQFDTLFSRKIDHMNQINAFASLGYSKVEVDQLNLQAKQGNCLIDINIDRNNQFTGSLLPPCGHGVVIGDAHQYNLDINKDLNYSSMYASFGGSWNWRYQNFESQLAYQYQYIWRNDIDDRIQNFGQNTIKDNHSIGLKLSYALHPKLTAFVQGEMYQHNFIGQIPFLYNGTTASRLERRYGLASFGLRLHSF